MKKVLAIAATLLLLCSARAEVYPSAMMVTEIESDTVTLTTYSGIEFQFDGAEDWMIGDIAAVMMEGNNTASVYDDEIVEVRYAGTIGLW